jgi:hypothetical protein
MLERIVNIAPGSDYQKSSAKSSRYTRSAHFLHSLNSTMNDSISLSPATAYLSTIRWKLKKLNNEREKIVVAFEFDEFDFTATLEQLSETKTIDYEVRKTINKIPYVYQAVIGIGSNSLKKQREKFDMLDHLPILNSFFDELVRLSDYTANMSVDNAQAKEAFFDKEKNLKPEFEYVNGCVITFLEKYLSMNLSPAEVRDGENDNLLLKKIQISRL